MARSLAACRPRSSARDRAARPCVRPLLCGPTWPLPSSLPSTTSAAAAGAGLCCLAPGSLGAGAALVLWHGPTPCVRASRACPWGAPRGPCGDGHGPPPGLPGPAHEVSVHARGLRPRQGRGRLAQAACPLWPAACAERVGTQIGHCGALYPACTFPCQRCTDAVTAARA
jgi:hypothetical protein